MKIGIVGAAGRMGRMLVHAVKIAPHAELAGGTEHKGSKHLGMSVWTLDAPKDGEPVLVEDARALFEACDAVIDFTTPAATQHHAELAADTGTRLVIGTTGLEDKHLEAIKAAAQKTAIVKAANFSVGVNVLLGLVEQAARILPEAYDIEIVEMHHRHKVDAPSGTALALGHAAADGRGVKLDDVSQRVRDGYTGEREEGAIGFATLRGGDVVGDHTVIYAGPGERVEISHKAASREIFANGAVRAALWTKDQAPGLYSMNDVLGF